MQRVGKKYFRPMFQKIAEVLREGIGAGEFRPVNPMDFLPSVVGIIIFYFSAAPVMKTLMKVDPLSVERIRERRGWVVGVDFAGPLSGAPAPRRERRGTKEASRQNARICIRPHTAVHRQDSVGIDAP